MVQGIHGRGWGRRGEGEVVAPVGTRRVWSAIEATLQRVSLSVCRIEKKGMRMFQRYITWIQSVEHKNINTKY